MGTVIDNSRLELTNVQPIKSLTPYQQRWTIKARITQKGDLKTWKNARGSGKLVSVNLLDSDGGEIRATLFNEAVDRYFNELVVEKVYVISKGQVKLANKKFNNLRNDYELSLDQNSIIQICKDQQEDIPHQHFSFTAIAEISNCEKDDNVDVIGIVTNVGDLGTIMIKNSDSPREAKKRNVTLLDETSNTIEVTLWGKHADIKLNSDESPILAIKGARVSTYNNRTLNTGVSSQVLLNPSIPKAEILRGWFDCQGGHVENTFPLSKNPSGGTASPQGKGGVPSTERKTIAQGKAAGIGKRDKPIYFETVAVVSVVKGSKSKKNSDQSSQNSIPIWYHACPAEKCSKKVIQNSSGMWRCDNCLKDYPTSNLRYILSFETRDHTGTQWVNCFNDVGVALLGKEASELERLELEDPQKYEEVFENASLKKYKLKIRAKEEMYNEEAKLRCSVMSAIPVDFVTEAQHLIQQIKLF